MQKNNSNSELWFGIQTHKFHLKHFHFHSPTDSDSMFLQGHLEETKQRRHVQFGKLIPGMKKLLKERKRNAPLEAKHKNFCIQFDHFTR